MPELVEQLNEANDILARLTWQFQGVTRDLEKCVALARENNAALGAAVSELERHFFPPGRPRLNLVSRGDDA
jgi:hypothetical protein